MRKGIIIYVLIIAGMLQCVSSMGQERVVSLHYNGKLSSGGRHGRTSGSRTTATALTLPFFEDFTGYSPYPDSTKWVEDEVYINNTMCVSPISRGVATFDCLNQYGIPYDTINTNDFEYCDSLTSQPIDLSLNVPGDSLYLSFFYQAQGNGFYPTDMDTLHLYLKNTYGYYEQVWYGVDTNTQVQPFRQVMIPITNTLYFNSTFQFRFVNYGSLDYADADWNVDYIRLNSGRNINDTLVNDIAWSSDPSFLLNDYTYMPYRQFIANPAAEAASQYTDSIHNDQTSPYFVNYGYMATALNTGAVLQPPAVVGTIPLSSGAIEPVSYPAYTTTIPLSSVGLYDKVTFENTFYISGTATGNTTNDTIIKDQVFDNYIAYDDGTAEKSYFLNLSPTLPGRIAIEYHLNQPDTMRGLAIYFGRTAPLQDYKNFSILVYGALLGVDGSATEDTFHQEDYFTPSYVDTINRFWVYTFDTPVVLPAGTFYAGLMQYAESGDDSLMIGLDVNRIGPNHAYYNVLDEWEPSGVSGALMIRPILGQPVQSSAVTALQKPEATWSVMPDPAVSDLTFTIIGAASARYSVTDMTGRGVMAGNINSGSSIDITPIPPGMYLVNLIIDGIPGKPKKIIKL